MSLDYKLFDQFVGSAPIGKFISNEDYEEYIYLKKLKKIYDIKRKLNNENS